MTYINSLRQKETVVHILLYTTRALHAFFQKYIYPSNDEIKSRENEVDQSLIIFASKSNQNEYNSFELAVYRLLWL